ncbi:MAG: response regulator [Saprospiraceae bacterium]|nr:response regulator [Saprospiraceae bacterium]
MEQSPIRRYAFLNYIALRYALATPKPASVLLVMLLALLVCKAGTGQSYVAKVEHFNIHEGLSSQHVTCIVQAPDGILWVATQDGLNRFDGFKFTEFNTQNSDLQSNLVGFMHLGPDNHLYVYTGSATAPQRIAHVQYLDMTTLLFHDVDPGLAQMVAGTRISTLQYMEGVLFTKPHIRAYSFAACEEIHLEVPGKHTWEKSFLHYAWSLHNPLTLIDLHDPEVLIDAELSDAPMLRLYRDLVGEHGRVGEGMLDPVREVFWHARQNVLMGSHLHGTRVTFGDGSDSLQFPRKITHMTAGERLFVGTESGFYIVALEPVRFRNYFTESAPGGLVDAPQSRGIMVFGDTIYTCLQRGVYQSPLSDPQHIEVTRALARPQQLIMVQPRAMLVGGQHIYRLDLDRRTLHPLMRRDQIVTTWALALINNHLYVSDINGLHRAPLRWDTIQYLSGPATKIAAPGRNLAYQFASLNAEEVLIVGSSGLFIARDDLSHLRQVRFVDPAGTPGAFSHFTHVMRDDKSDFWITSLDGGLVHFTLSDTTARIIDQLNRDDGVPTNTFYAVYPDELGSFWCSTDLGIVQVDTSTWSFQIYSQEDGMRNLEFNRLSHFRDARGDIYFGGLEGVTAFSPQDFYSERRIPLRLNVLQVQQYSGWENQVVTTTAAFRTSQAIRLAPGDNFFELEVGLNDLFQTNMHQYQYRLVNLDEEWLSVPGNRIRIHGLPFGNHLLEIRGKNTRGVAAENILQIPVTVMRPLHLRWWFLLGVALGLVLIIREYWTTRTRRMRSQARKLERLVEERTEEVTQKAAELQKMVAARTRFFANISHELRTPLTLIKGPLQGLLSGKRTEEQKRDYVKIIDYNADLLSERIEDLLTLARSDSGNLEVRKSAVRLNSLLERIVDSFQGLAKERKIRLLLQNQLPADTVIRTDPRKLEHILSNFLSNAMRYTDSGTTVTVTCTRDQELLVVSVRDEGPGIAPDLLEKIFERYYQGEHLQGGAGIGLSLSRELAGVMQGRVWAESEVGLGSTFHVAFPYEPAEDEVAEEAVAPTPPLAPTPLVADSGQGSAPRILCVEDNRSMRAYLTAELQAYQVTTCENGLQALRLLEQMSSEGTLPDCIVSDVMMPEMDGFELAQQIRASSQLSSLPIILLTARAGQDDKLTGLRIGVDDYITKPFDAEELRIRINNLVGRKPMKQEAIAEAGEDVSAVDQKWLRAVEEHIMGHLHERDFTIDRLAWEMHMSRSKLYRRIKAFTGLTPHHYLREARLYKAKEFLESGEAGTIAQLSAAVGFEDPGYFSRIYAQRFGYRPAERI